MSGGFTGVDVFFVISGFLISSIILQNLDKGIFSFGEFYARRVRRIFPALVLVLAASYAFGWFALLPEEYRQFGRHVAAGAVFASNFQLWSESGYFDNAADTKPLLHLWSLAIEEQFYIVWPLLLRMAGKAPVRLLLTVGIIAGSFYLGAREVRIDAAGAFYLPHMRFWELLCGGGLAWLALYTPRFPAAVAAGFGVRPSAPVHGKPARQDAAVPADVVSCAGLLLLAYGFFRIDRNVSFPGPWALVPVLGAVLMIAAGPGAWLNRTVLSHRIAVWFGLISYPLYLWHWPLLSFARIVGNGVPGIPVRAGAAGASVVLAWLTYRFVERPVRRSGGNANARTAVLTGLMAMAGSVGYLTWAEDGLAFRRGAIFKGHEIFSYYQYLVDRYSVCTPAALADEALRWEGFTRCMQSKPGPDVDIALIGDSHAEHLFAGLAAALPDRNVAYYIKGAPAFYGRPEFQNIYRHVMASPGIRHVVLAMAWEPGLAQVPSGSSPEREISQVIDALIRAGKKVWLTDDVPVFPFTGTECKRYRWFGWKNPRCEVGAETEMHRHYLAVLRKIARNRTDVRLIETMKYFCDGAVCSMLNGNEVLYRDAHHLNIAGSLFLGRKIVEDNAGLLHE